MTHNSKPLPVKEGQIKEATLKFADLGISDTILRVLEKLNLSEPTPIQAKTIPIALSGQDLIGVAQTGTGKTFAFGIPMLQALYQTPNKGLVIAPTRELAAQVEESLRKLGSAMGLRTAILIGGEDFNRQLFSLKRDPHIIVATPGRLNDHLKRRTLRLTNVKVLVLDEADMMLDMGFAPQIKEVLSQAPTERQTMLFSATMPPAIVKIATEFMKLPISIEVAPPGTTAKDVDQEIFIIKNEDRTAHLEKVLATYTGSVLVFVRTKHGADKLTLKLQANGHKAVAIHSNLSLGKRKTALTGFKNKISRILVATDVAARGLDIKDIELVVNFNLPDNSEDYVHRIGRTARAGKSGKAITFVAPSEQKNLFEIERLIKQKIKRTEFVSMASTSFAPSAGRGKQKLFKGSSRYNAVAKPNVSGYKPRHNAPVYASTSAYSAKGTPDHFGRSTHAFTHAKSTPTRSFGGQVSTYKPGSSSAHSPKFKPKRAFGAVSSQTPGFKRRPTNARFGRRSRDAR